MNIGEKWCNGVSMLANRLRAAAARFNQALMLWCVLVFAQLKPIVLDFRDGAPHKNCCALKFTNGSTQFVTQILCQETAGALSVHWHCRLSAAPPEDCTDLFSKSCFIPFREKDPG